MEESNNGSLSAEFKHLVSQSSEGGERARGLSPDKRYRESLAQPQVITCFFSLSFLPDPEGAEMWEWGPCQL